MASYKGVQGAMVALETFFKRRLPTELSDEPVNASIRLLGSSDIAEALKGNLLGIYLHRMTVDPHGRTRHFTPQGTQQGGRFPELPVNLHFLMIANAISPTVEADLMAWAMLELANDSCIDSSYVHDIDEEWGEREALVIAPEEMSTEDLMRIWDVFESPYTSTVPYVARTVRMRLRQQRTVGPDVQTRIFPAGTV
jgi:Pvc16 N-terminal domain